MDKNVNSTTGDLIGDLSSSDDLIRVKARNSLIAIGTPAVPRLLCALKDPDPLVRWEAISALTEIGGEEAIPGLVQALEDEAFEVRWLAIEGLIKMDAKALKPLLQALAERADSNLLREGAHRVLHYLSKEEVGECLGGVLKALEEGGSAVRVHIAAIEAMELLEEFEKKPKEDDSLLKEFLAMPNQRILAYNQHRLAHRYAGAYTSQHRPIR